MLVPQAARFAHSEGGTLMTALEEEEVLRVMQQVSSPEAEILNLESFHPKPESLSRVPESKTSSPEARMSSHEARNSEPETLNPKLMTALEEEEVLRVMQQVNHPRSDVRQSQKSIS